MTTRQTTPSRPKGSGDQVHDFQAICQRVVDNAYAERAALAARPKAEAVATRTATGRAPAPRFSSVKQVADFILGAGRGIAR